MPAGVDEALGKHRAYRRRLAAGGQHQLVVALPKDLVAVVDEIKESQGLRNRSQALLQLIERGIQATQKT